MAAESARRGLRNVTFVESQPKAMMPRVWSLVDVALVHLKDTPVFGTVIPSKIFEAMASGKPVLLAAPAGEASALVEQEAAGLHVRSGDLLALAAAVQSFSEDEAGRERMALAGLRAAPRYSRERQAKAMIDLFGGLADEKQDRVRGGSAAELHEAGSVVAGAGAGTEL